MKRLTITPRPDWQERLDKLGFHYHSIDGDYWQEKACYVFNAKQIDILEQATETLHELYLQACSEVIKAGDFERLGFNALQAKLIEDSFYRQDPTLYGRFDISYDGIHPPKLLEYNADTPSTLFEASVAQWYWLKEQQPTILPSHADQFNSIHERLMVQWKHIASHYSQAHRFDKKIAEKLSVMTDNINWYDMMWHFSAIGDSLEDFTTCRYLQDTAIQAGLTTEFIDIQDIGWDSERLQFVDNAYVPIEHLFKLYPWEFLSEEDFSSHLPTATTHWLEPAWKLMLSNKAMLAILWEKFPHHPNLLPSYFSPEPLGNSVVKKPFFSREGLNVTLQHEDATYMTGGDYDNGNFVYQACQPLPEFINEKGQKVYALIGSWVVGHCSAGMGMREDTSLITKDNSMFVPHFFID